MNRIILILHQSCGLVLSVWSTPGGLIQAQSQAGGQNPVVAQT